MQLKWLEDFLILAETRSFSRAAEIRHVTQPAFGRRIRSLETWLGVQLIDRESFPPTLTGAGKIFYEAASEVVQRLSGARDLLNSQEQRPACTLVVAASHTLGITHYPKLMSELEDAVGGLDARVSAINSHDGVLLLVEGGCDLVMSYHHAELGRVLDEERYPFLVLGVDEVVPVSRPDENGHPIHALPGSASSPTNYLSYTSTIFLGRAVNAILDRVPEPVHLRRSHEIEMAQALKAMVLEGRGMGWLPSSVVTEDLASGRLVSALPPELSREERSWSTPLEVRLYRAAENRKGTLNRIWAVLAERDSVKGDTATLVSA